MRRELARRVKRLEDEANKKIKNINGIGICIYEEQDGKYIMSAEENTTRAFDSEEDMKAYIDNKRYEDTVYIQVEWV